MRLRSGVGMVIDPIAGTAHDRGPSGTVQIGSVVYAVNPRSVDHKQKAKNRAHRKAVRAFKRRMRRAGKPC